MNARTCVYTCRPGGKRGLVHTPLMLSFEVDMRYSRLHVIFAYAIAYPSDDKHGGRLAASLCVRVALAVIWVEQVVCCIVLTSNVDCHCSCTGSL